MVVEKEVDAAADAELLVSLALAAPHRVVDAPLGLRRRQRALFRHRAT